MIASLPEAFGRTHGIAAKPIRFEPFSTCWNTYVHAGHSSAKLRNIPTSYSLDPKVRYSSNQLLRMVGQVGGGGSQLDGARSILLRHRLELL